ncbi:MULTISPECIES: hypothetical protein [unclassified Streptomyces]|uniref:hypothetical protein n=1 Tax=unclassified Streptomyces TaxID=2593676 RepID=UPI002E801ADA|nr:hypothetical protein [Streptomyces sp. NBC_00589]WTI40497.1 hypothetical protein OIC96_38630 [Streptomyces sp. NBC_00775]WUB25819.1 hypothetical protein OHA51_11100 [Streptomyces sp. NBC_00589]
MNTIPQMSQQGQQQGQQGPSTAPPQQFGQQQGMGQQQPFGQQMQQPIGQQGIAQQQIPQQHIAQQHIPQHLQQQLQQLGQQQPYQQLLQQLGGQQQQLGQPLVLSSAVETQSLVSGVATRFWDVVTPLPGQPSILYLLINNVWHGLVNPNQVTHDEVQEAFAYGQQVIGIFDSTSGAIQAVIVNK